MPINVSSALCGLTAITTTVERTSAGGYVDGLYVPGSTSTFKVLSSVQQPTANELRVLPEGERDRDIKKFICNKLIRTTNDRDGVIADKIFHRGVWYKIIRAEDWNDYGHTTAYGARVE